MHSEARGRVVMIDVDELREMLEDAVRRGLEGRAERSEPPEWLDANGAAELLGVTPRTVRKRVASGALRASRIGKLLRIKRADVVALLERGG